MPATPEWPILEEMILNPEALPVGPSENLPNGSRVLDVGCSYGWFIRWAREKGAAYVKGFEAEINRQVILVRTTEAILEIHYLETINLSQHPGQELQDLSRISYDSSMGGDSSIFSVEHHMGTALVYLGLGCKVIWGIGKDRKV
ncbi:hypothetical protein N7537_001594 [Penicillium hordei]|uniref:Uncharacterized protein n=1 Tax=Penicillium hordei TaxID=40994 RepID=A0AAD6EGY5_9EURO|nr:uncharacterized protein N7537_001594 [Penicillium hordei]KAJ5616480.1 hypothetical protein N7537_001594 [Penicillium hordei]